MEADGLLRSMAEALLARELERFLLKVLAMDRLAESSRLTMQDVEELDRKIKRGLRLRIEAQISGGHE